MEPAHRARLHLVRKENLRSEQMDAKLHQFHRILKDVVEKDTEHLGRIGNSTTRDPRRSRRWPG